jgi:hypothetical protein
MQEPSRTKKIHAADCCPFCRRAFLDRDPLVCGTDRKGRLVSVGTCCARKLRRVLGLGVYIAKPREAEPDYADILRRVDAAGRA